MPREDSRTCTGIEFKPMQEGLVQAEKRVTDQLEEMRTTASDKMDIGKVFKLQFDMNKLAQFIEAHTNVISAVHSAIQTVTRNVK